MIILVIFGVVTLIGASFHLGFGAPVIGAVAAGIWYISDVKAHPKVPCRWPGCKGSGAEASRIGRGSSLFRNPFGDCRCCGGKKAHPRLALWIVDNAEHKRIRAEIARAKGKT